MPRRSIFTPLAYLLPRVLTPHVRRRSSARLRMRPRPLSAAHLPLTDAPSIAPLAKPPPPPRPNPQATITIGIHSDPERIAYVRSRLHNLPPLPTLFRAPAGWLAGTGAVMTESIWHGVF